MIGSALFTLFLHSAFAAERIMVPPSLGERMKTFEPSAIIYLTELNRYLVASDDTDKDDTPLLFFMDQNGAIDQNPIAIKGIEKLTDIESLSQDSEGNILILSSLSLNRNGKNRKERNMLIQARLEGRELHASHTIELRPLLLKALENNNDPELFSMRNRFENELNIESSFVRNGDLYIGFKGPQPESGQAILLNLGPLEKIFSNQTLDLKVWKAIDFAALTREEDRLSDMILFENNLIFSTTNNNGNGRLWIYSPESRELSLLSEFKGLHPEGLALRPHSKDLMVVFDQDNNEPLFTHFPLPLFH